MMSAALRCLAGLAHVAVVATANGQAHQGERTFVDSLPRLVVKEDLRVGDADDPRRGFSAILFAAIDRDGNIFVFESRDNEIRVFSSTGIKLRTIGRSGRGPGEFTRVTAMGVVGDSVWTVDGATQVLTVFRRDGTLVSTTVAGNYGVSLHHATIGALVPDAMLADGRFVSHLAAITPPRQANEVGDKDTVLAPRLRYKTDAVSVDTIGWEPVPPPDSTDVGSIGVDRVKVGGQVYSVPQPPLDRAIRLATNDGTVIITRKRSNNATSGEFDLARFDFQGHFIQRLRFAYKPSRYAGPVLDIIARRPIEAGGKPNEAAFAAVRSALVYPEFQSPVYAAWVAHDSSIWLRREDNATARFRWLVVSASGVPRGVVELPRNTRPLWADGDTILLAELDPLGVPWLVRCKVLR